MSEIDPKLKSIAPRTENRYIIEEQNLHKFISQINTILKSQNFETDYNHTIYFNNLEHEVPFEVSIKGRRYSKSSDLGVLDYNEEWILEIKEDIIKDNSRLRKKTREILSLKEIINKVQKINEINKIKINNPLKPYIASTYKRTHYIIDKEKNYRITIDTNINYYLFNDGLQYQKIGQEPYARIEIKIPENTDEIEISKIVGQLLKDSFAEPTISKKDAAYNYLSNYLITKFKRYRKSDTEIEAKFTLTKENQNIINKIKTDFLTGKIKGFKILTDFPYILESGKLHRYIIKPDTKKIYRISVKGNEFKLITKNNTELIKDKYGLNCILKRKEITEQLDLELLKSPYKQIYRKRKYFIVENEFLNSFCILVDRSTQDSKELFEVEIEVVLFLPSDEEIQSAIDSISFIGNFLVNKYKYLKPEPLTKLEWIDSNR